MLFRLYYVLEMRICIFILPRWIERSTWGGATSGRAWDLEFQGLGLGFQGLGPAFDILHLPIGEEGDYRLIVKQRFQNSMT